ncbi:hypothetical protein CTP10_R65860 (plasmid) [Cupriavidus sp. P-10]|uniref:hypothetical protein n=1 Tax=Cupriavidus sp. P-10 TaxID=2027911 RepID=UPI00131414FC|nr:hypothetical protein [Cupriavidus sp. P-10]BDB29173.1 hypothetical protein CTP10_R65860 [Cupriavidus sp. P-10]
MDRDAWVVHIGWGKNIWRTTPTQQVDLGATLRRATILGRKAAPSKVDMEGLPNRRF